MVMPKYIDEILNWFNMETPRKSSYRMEKVDATLSVFMTLDERNKQAMLCTQTRYVLCSNCCGNVPE